ncbi:hypothetical protein AB0B89_35745, partial [Sphaerisporangium sp. NPDC049002]|uniref:hypothetical protein n=1 Tax=Sphaerisporangium sp. NPDC049002 TaxID=3155392 RepID=UPI00340DE053
VPSPKVSAYRHGMVGGVRAFTVDLARRPVELHCKLPGPKGTQEIQRVPSEEAACKRAREMLAEFLDRLGRACPLPPE